MLWTLYRRELGAIFHSAIAYVVLVACALSQGVTFAIAVNFLNDYGIRQYTVLQMVFNGFFFWLTLLVVSPLVTMRSFSEEWKAGTMEMLLTAPLREWEVVLAKFGAALTFFVVLWLPTAINLEILTFLQPNQALVPGATSGLSFLIIILMGMLFVSMGIFSSVLTKNQIIAAVLAFALIFIFFALGILTYLRFDPSLKPLQQVLTAFSCLEHCDVYQRGIFDSRAVVWYVSLTVFFLFLTTSRLNAQRLRG